MLGRPFMKTSNTKIDVGRGTVSMEFDQRKIEYGLKNILEHPPDTRGKSRVAGGNPG